MPYQTAPEIPPDFEAAAPGRKREKRKIKDILFDKPYGQGPYAQLGVFCVEPTVLDISRAVASGNLDERPFEPDTHAALYDEFEKISELNNETAANLGKYIYTVQQYHAHRVAYFVVTKWKNPIIGLDAEGHLRDGGHRIRAAMFMGWEDIWVEYPELVPATP